MKVFIGVMAYDQRINSLCALSLIQSIRTLEKAGHEVIPAIEAGRCYITEARNFLVSHFLNSDCDMLVFVDSDLAFGGDAILKVVEADKDVCFGAYPYKTQDGYPVQLFTHANGTPIVEDGLLKAQCGPTGMMAIKRGVFDHMISENPQWKTERNEGGVPQDVYMVFDTGIHREPGKWYGEDYLFCLRWIDLGGEVWCQPDIGFIHIGVNHKYGNYKDYLQEQPKPEELTHGSIPNMDSDGGACGADNMESGREEGVHSRVGSTTAQVPA